MPIAIRFLIPDSKVLVVDDLPVNLQVARGLLKPYGPQVDTATSGQEAIDLVQRHCRAGDKQYDLILMDHMMPGMDGVETAKVIRAWENERQKNNEQSEFSLIPIVALTANAMQGMKEFYLEHGFQDYISKPVDPLLLDDAINRWIPEDKRIEKTVDKQAAATMFQEQKAHVNFAKIMEAHYLDKLNHYRVSFESLSSFDEQPKSAELAKFDQAYFEKFTALINSLDTADMDPGLRETAALLKDAGQRIDVKIIRETLPAFYEALKIRQENEVQDKRQLGKILYDNLQKLKKAILSEETETIKTIMGELGTIDLGPLWRELYFLLNDLFLTGDTEKALGAISLWERMQSRG